MKITAFFTDSGVPEIGLSPTIRIRDLFDNSLVVIDEPMTEVGDGHYQYDFITYDTTLDYAIRCDGTATLTNADRYKYAGNENYYDDIQDSVWSARISGFSPMTVGAGFITLLYGDYIHVDATSPWSDPSIFGVGTHARPVNNIAGAVTIANSRNIKKLQILSDVTVEADDNISRFALETIGVMGTELTLTPGCSADGAVFRNLNMQGEMTNGDVVLIEDCSILNLDNFSGIMNVVAFSSTSEISLGTWATIIQGLAGGSPTSEPEITIGTAQLNMHHWEGHLKLKGQTGDVKNHIGVSQGSVIIDSTCIEGTIHIDGIGTVVDNSGPNCQVDVDSFITNASIANWVWDENLSDHDATGAKMGGLLQRIGGLVHENIYIDNPIYDGDGNMTSARLRLYSAPGSVGTANDVIGTYEITAPSDGAGRFTSWKQVKI
jgi:hypothetical protein